MKSLLVGLAVGVGLGFLFAPARGENTRHELGERLNDMARNDQRKAPQAAQRVGEAMKPGTESEDDDLISEIRSKKDHARFTSPAL
jgi:gas vesicle protein